MKHIGWRVVSGDPNLSRSEFVNFHDLADGPGCALDADGNWKPGHPQHYQFWKRNFVIKDMKKIYVEDES